MVTQLQSNALPPLTMRSCLLLEPLIWLVVLRTTLRLNTRELPLLSLSLDPDPPNVRPAQLATTALLLELSLQLNALVVSARLVKVYLLNVLLASTRTPMLREWPLLKSASIVLTLSTAMED